MRRLTLALIVALLCPPVAAQAHHDEKNPGLSIELLLNLVHVRGAVMSPDGKRVVVTVAEPRSQNAKPGPGYTALWVYELGSDTLRRYTSRKGSVRSPGFTPDSKELTFLDRRDKGKTQVWTLPLTGGEADALTAAKQGVMAYALSPDGSHIAYTTLAEPDPERAKLAKKGRDANVVDSYFRHHLLVVEHLGSGEKVTVTPTDRSAFDFAWAPDGKQLVVMTAASPKNDDNYMFRSLWTVPAKGGKGTRLADGMGKMGHPRWSPDGKHIAWLGAGKRSDGTTGTVWVVPATGGTPRALNAGAEETAYDLTWRGGKELLVTAVEGTRSVLSVRALKDGKQRRLVTDGPVFLTASFDAKGRHYAVAGSTRKHPGELFVGKGKSLKRVTEHNPWLSQVTLGKQERIEWKAADGTRIEGVLVRPVGWTKDTRYPLVVVVHGGPEWQELDGWSSRYLGADHVLAAHGYAVLRPNYRGSSGRGVAFATADHKDLGGKEFDDIIAGVNHLVAQGLVQKGKVAMMGGSYGGYMSALAATKGTAHFAAAINFAGIGNWMSFMGTSDIPHEMSIVHWDLYCFDQPQTCWEASPLRFLDRAKTPLMIVHGAEDKRVPIGQAWELYTAFRYTKIPTELVIYPREGHGLRERAHQADFIERTLAWFDRHVRGRKVSTAPAQ